MRFIFSRPVEELTHEEIAAELRKSGNSDLVEMGERLQSAVDAEQSSLTIVGEIMEFVESME